MPPIYIYILTIKLHWQPILKRFLPTFKWRQVYERSIVCLCTETVHVTIGNKCSTWYITYYTHVLISGWFNDSEYWTRDTLYFINDIANLARSVSSSGNVTLINL